MIKCSNFVEDDRRGEAHSNEGSRKRRRGAAVVVVALMLQCVQLGGKAFLSDRSRRHTDVSNARQCGLE